MTLVQTEPKSIKIWTTNIKKVTIRPNGTEKQIRPEIPPYLCFTANTAGSKVKLSKDGSPTSLTLETSTDGSTWSTYTFGTTITLSNIDDKVYFRNTSTTTTGFSTSSSNYYYFTLTWSIAASWDITSLINKNLSTALTSNYCFYRLFYSQTKLTSVPELPATTLKSYCYDYMFTGCTWITAAPKLPATTLVASCYTNMFRGCTQLETLPKLPATTLKQSCYEYMFYGCSKIKLSATQTWEYQTAYRIPTTWTWTDASDALRLMFSDTWWTFTSSPSINTTYYTSNTLV